MLSRPVMESKIDVINKRLVTPVVYLVDCDREIQRSLCELLNQNDVAVEVFESAEDLLKTKLRTRAACLIVEVNLPNMDGIELLEHINNLGVRLPTIVLSSNSNVTEAVRAMQAKAIDFIEKPFVKNSLIKKVLDVIGRV